MVKLMSEHKASVSWKRNNQNFLNNQYSRSHQWKFDGGIEIEASSSPLVVPFPLSNPSAIDPEEAFVASISSCHMLWFLSIAAKRKYCVDSYSDDAIGVMEKNSNGYFYISKVLLKPQVYFSGSNQPNNDELLDLHEESHKNCFIANSVKTEIICKPINNQDKVDFIGDYLS